MIGKKLESNEDKHQNVVFNVCMRSFEILDILMVLHLKGLDTPFLMLNLSWENVVV